MRCGRQISLAIVGLSVLVLACGAGAQPPAPSDAPPPSTPPTSPGPEPVPGQPAPVSPPPTTPAVPTPPPTAKEEPETLPPPEAAIEPRTVPEELLPTGVPTLLGPSVFVGPDLFNPPAQQGWLSITPAFTLSGEYNDNLFQDSSNKTSDFKIGLIPSLTASVQRRGFNLLAGYSVGGELFVDNSDLNNFGKSQQFFANLAYQLTPRLSFFLTEGLVVDQNSNAVTTTGESAGRRNGVRNTLIPRLRWQATPSTGLNASFSYNLERFEDQPNHDTYRLGVGVDHQLTGRLIGLLDFNAAHLDVEGESPVRSYTLRPGFSYAVTPTLRVDVRAGPSLIDGSGDTEVRPSATASLVKAFKFASLRLGYDRNVRASEDTVADVQAFFGTLVVPTLVRGLQLSFTPRYSIVDRDFVSSGEESETHVVTLNLRATYQITRNISMIGAYTFFHQTDDRRGIGDIDQNRVFLGVQYAFPINFY